MHLINLNESIQILNGPPSCCSQTHIIYTQQTWEKENPKCDKSLHFINLIYSNYYNLLHFCATFVLNLLFASWTLYRPAGFCRAPSGFKYRILYVVRYHIRSGSYFLKLQVSRKESNYCRQDGQVAVLALIANVYFFTSLF